MNDFTVDLLQISGTVVEIWLSGGRLGTCHQFKSFQRYSKSATTLLQQISENIKPIQQIENTTFNNDVNVTNKYNLMKDYVKEINI